MAWRKSLKTLWLEFRGFEACFASLYIWALRLVLLIFIFEFCALFNGDFGLLFENAPSMRAKKSCAGFAWHSKILLLRALPNLRRAFYASLQTKLTPCVAIQKSAPLRRVWGVFR